MSVKPKRVSKEVTVTQVVQVSIDETKFTPEFMSEFRESMYPFQTIDEHIEHLGQLFARGIANGFSFIEGYGEAKFMGIEFEQIGGDQEITRD